MAYYNGNKIFLGTTAVGGSGSAENAVLYVEQELTEEQQEQARENVGAASATDVEAIDERLTNIEENGAGGSVDGAVLYTPQTLTPEQQAQARENIGAGTAGDATLFWESGTFNVNDGSPSNSTTRIRTTDYIPAFSSVSVADGYRFVIVGYNGSTYVGTLKASGGYTKASLNWLMDKVDYAKVNPAYHHKIALSRVDDGNITVDEQENLIILASHGDRLASHDERLYQLEEGLQDLRDEVAIDPEMFVANNIPWEYASDNYISHEDGTENPSGTYRCTNYINVSGFKDLTYRRYKYKGNYIVSGMAFYDKDYLYISGLSHFLNQSENGYQDYTIEVPENAVYARFTYLKDTTAYGDFGLSGTIGNVWDVTQNNKGESAESNDTLIYESLKYVHTVPDNVGVLNAIKRARQITDIKWTPAVDIPRVSKINNDDGSIAFNEDTFKQGVEYTGIPYSATETGVPEQYGYTRMHVGFEAPIDTFITAVSNANSVVSKQSEINSNNTACVYGLTCTSFISYVYGFSTYYDTATIQNVDGMSWRGSVVNGGTRFDLNSLKLCDMLLYGGRHGVLVTDIIKDENGTVTLIEVSECTVSGKYAYGVNGSQYSGLTRRKLWCVDDFFTYFANYAVYRYSGLASVTYTPNKYAPIEKDGVFADDPCLPCIPYMGDKFTYKYGNIHNSTLLTYGGYFTHIKVEKDGNIFNSNGTDDFYTIGADGITEIGFTEVGNYKATPCKLSDTSWVYGKSCSWQVQA